MFLKHVVLTASFSGVDGTLDLGSTSTAQPVYNRPSVIELFGSETVTAHLSWGSEKAVVTQVIRNQRRAPDKPKLLLQMSYCINGYGDEDKKSGWVW